MSPNDKNVVHMCTLSNLVVHPGFNMHGPSTIWKAIHDCFLFSVFVFIFFMSVWRNCISHCSWRIGTVLGGKRKRGDKLWRPHKRVRPMSLAWTLAGLEFNAGQVLWQVASGETRTAVVTCDNAKKGDSRVLMLSCYRSLVHTVRVSKHTVCLTYRTFRKGQVSKLAPLFFIFPTLRLPDCSTIAGKWSTVIIAI